MFSVKKTSPRVDLSAKVDDVDDDDANRDTNDDIEFAWDDQFVDEDDIRRDRKSTRATANSLKTLDQQMGRGRNRPSLSSTTSGKSAALRSYDLETDEY